MTGRAVLCDHFVFGSAPAAGGGRHRYGIVARSAGVDAHTLRLLGGYLHPAGVDPAAFVRSSSLLVLDGVVAFTQARNAGHDGEGRPNSIYSHTTLIGERDFEAIGNDTRVLAMQTPHVGGAGDLGPLEVRPLRLGIDLASAKRLGFVHLRPFLEAALSGGRVAIKRTSDPDLLPDLLSLLPAQLRLRPFSTLLADPSRQPSYAIVQTDAPPSTLGRYRVVDPAGARPRAPSSLLGRCAGHVARLVSEGDEAAVARLHEEFAAVPELARRDRMCLVAGAQMYDAGLHRSEADAERLARMLESLPRGRAAAYFNRLGRFLADGDRARHAQRYGARLVTVQYEDRALDAAAFLEMLDRCGEGGGTRAGAGASARALVRDLLDQRPDDLRSAGGAILAAVAPRPDAQGVVEEFAAAERLRPAILAALSGPPALDAGPRRRLLLLAARPLLAAGPRHFADLLAAGARDLATDEGAGLFFDAASALLSGPAGGADLGSLAGAAEALHDRASGQLSRGKGACEEPRHGRLRAALAGVRDALAGADERARRDGAPADEPARQRAALAIEKIESLIGGARAAPHSIPFHFSASEAPPFWQWWRSPALKSSSAAK